MMQTAPSTIVIRCEGCGYDLRGISHEAVCPECARAVASSLPTARAGIAWQQRRGLRSWMMTGLGSIWAPARTGLAVRLELASLRSLCFVNLALTWVAFLIPGTLSLVFGPRMLSLTPGGSRTLVIDDHASLLAAAAFVAVQLYLGISLWVCGQRLFRGRNCRESYWAAMALGAYPLAFASLFLLGTTLIIRALPKDAVYQPPVGMLGLFIVAWIANRWLVVFAAMAIAALVHWTVFRRTRFANPIRAVGSAEA